MAASTLSGSLQATLTWLNNQTTALTGGQIQDSGSLKVNLPYTDDSGAHAANTAHLVFYDAQPSLAASGHIDYTLSAMPNLTMFAANESLVFTKVRAIIIANLNTASGDAIYIDTSVTHAFKDIVGTSVTAQIQCGPNSTLVISNMTDGFGPIVAATNDVLRIVNASGSHSNSFQIAIIGY